jgi:hypothetical protein
MYIEYEGIVLVGFSRMIGGYLVVENSDGGGGTGWGHGPPPFQKKKKML